MLPRRTVLATLAVALAAGTAVTAPAAQAAPANPTGWRIAAVTASSVTVTTTAVRGAASYRVAVASSTARLTVAYLRAHGFGSDRTAAARSNRVTVSGLRYSTAPYYYRVGVTYSRYRNDVAWGATASSAFGLRPATPSGLRVIAGAAGSYLAWTAGASTGAQIEQTSTTGAVTKYTIHNTTARFTPYALTAGARYTVRVRAINVHSYSAPSAPVTFTGPASYTRLRVMSYNVLGAYLTTSSEPDGRTVHYAGWAQRVTTAAALVDRYRPDVLTVQEGNTILGTDAPSNPGNHAYPSAAWPGTWPVPASSCNTRRATDPDHWPYRQVDSLCDAMNARLGSAVYARAVDGTAQHNGYGDYLIYNATTMQQVGDGGWALLDDSTSVTNPRYTGWAELRDRATGATVLVLSPHISAELGPGWDARRTTQVTNLVRFARTEAQALGVGRIVYAGDFNNYVGRPGLADSTTPVMRSNGFPDSIENAQHSYDTSYLSGNFYSVTPKRTTGDVPGYACLDHVYVSPGIAVQSFGEALALDSKGRFVGAIPSDHNPVYADLFLQS